MNKKVAISTILFFIALIGGIFLLPEKNAPLNAPNDDSSAKMVFYYGDTCPHCKIVEEFFLQNNIEDRVKFDKKEVYNNKSNQADLGKKAAKCGINPNNIGVPLFWDGSTCLVGDKPIMNFFKEKLNIR